MFSRSWNTTSARSTARTRHLLRRTYATEPPPQPTSRLARFEARLPRFLRRITTPLQNAPVSHITAFLVLHEITAIVPLFGLAAFFHYTEYLPRSFSEGKWVTEGTEKFGRYLRKKGWISEAEADDAIVEVQEEKGEERKLAGKNDGIRIVMELATAYAVTKAILPARLLVSVWGTPWFARWTVLPVMNVMRRVLGRSSGK